VGEFTYREADTHLGTLFHKWFSTKASIKISHNSTYMELTLPASKTDPFRKGIKLTIAATQDEGCPVEAMKRFQERDTHRPTTAPLFCVDQHTSNQRPFSREYVVSKLQHLARIAGLTPGTWNGHSLRSGAATSAAQAGMSAATIQILGRGNLMHTSRTSNTHASSGLHYQHGSSSPSHGFRPSNHSHQPASEG